jgi:hypothetical protein
MMLTERPKFNISNYDEFVTGLCESRRENLGRVLSIALCHFQKRLGHSFGSFQEPLSPRILSKKKEKFFDC